MPPRRLHGVRGGLVSRSRCPKMKRPRTIARAIEESTVLPPGHAERFLGYGVIGLPLGRTGPPSQPTLTTTLPFLCPWSTYRCASTI